VPAGSNFLRCTSLAVLTFQRVFIPLSQKFQMIKKISPKVLSLKPKKDSQSIDVYFETGLDPADLPDLNSFGISTGGKPNSVEGFTLSSDGVVLTLNLRNSFAAGNPPSVHVNLDVLKDGGTSAVADDSIGLFPADVIDVGLLDPSSTSDSGGTEYELFAPASIASKKFGDTGSLDFDTNAYYSIVSQAMQGNAYAYFSPLPSYNVGIDGIFSDSDTGNHDVSAALGIMGYSSSNVYASGEIQLSVQAVQWNTAVPLDGVKLTGGTAPVESDVFGSSVMALPINQEVVISAQKESSATELSEINKQINLKDVIGTLKIFLGLPVNQNGVSVTPLQALAADFDGNGRVELKDVIDVLKHFLGLSAPSPSWRFVNLDSLDIDAIAKDPRSPGIPPATSVNTGIAPTPHEITLSGYVPGDIDGSYSAPSVAPGIASASFNFGDSLNAYEAASDQVVNVSTANIPDGQTLTLTLDDTKFTGIVSKNTVQITVPTNTLQKLGQGTVTFTLDVVDALGNSAKQYSGQFVHDSIAPKANLTTVTDDAGTETGILEPNATTDDTTLVLSGTNEAGSSVKVYNGTTELGSAIVSGTSWTYSAAVVNGFTYAFNVKETDSAGNISEATSNFTVTSDTAAPSAPVITTSAGWVNDNTPTITGTAEAGSTVYLYVGSTQLGSAAADSSGDWSIEASTLVDATYLLSAKAADVAGNLSDPSIPVSLKVDTIAPTVSSIGISDSVAFMLSAPNNLSINGLIVTDSVDGVVMTGALNHALIPSRSLRYSLDGGTNWQDVIDTDTYVDKFEFSVAGLEIGANQLEMAVFEGASHGQISRQSIFVEGNPANITLADAYFNVLTNSLTLTGAGIDALLLPTENASTDIKDRLDWSKLAWDVSGTTTTISSADIESVHVVDASCLQINFSSLGASKLTTANVGAGNSLSLTSGFLQQVTGADITSATLIDGVIRVFSSASGETDAFDLSDQFVIDFGVPIQRGSGTIDMRDASGTIVERFDAATSASIAITGTSVTIKPTWKLQGSTGYYITYDDGAFENTLSESLPGISNSSVLSFQTSFENQNVQGFSPMRTEYPGDTVETLGMHSVLYVPLMFADIPTSPYATYAFKSPAFESNLVNLIRENTLNDTNDFYLSASQGAMTFNGVTSQPFIVPIAYSLQQQLTQIGIDKLSYPMLLAKDAATRAGYSTDNNVVVSHWNKNLIGPVALGGGNSVWLVPTTSDAAVLAHEAGHALDLGHASASFWGGGFFKEYGNVLDNMGTAEAINGDFGAFIKFSRLGWIEPEAYRDSPGPGVYRLNPMDQENRIVGAYYGLSQSIEKDGMGDDPIFYLEYRTSMTYDYWDNDLSPLKDQVLVLRNNVLIDRIDEGKDTQADAGIFVGETWHIPGSETYFSVLGKGQNSEYLDVVYLEGPFLNNIAPTAEVSVSSTNVASGDSVTFTTNAFDDNGDGLLYFWRFSDDVRGYGASYTRTFSQTAPTDITGTLIVSDMRGGTATHTITVHAGASASDSLEQTVGTISRITDATVPTVAINALNAVSVEGGELGQFVIKRAGTEFGSELTVNLAYEGSAERDTDYTAPATVTIAAGQSQVSFDITPVNDTVLEASETITVSIVADNSTYVISGQNAAAKIELRDNDAPVVTVEVLDSQAVEGSGDRAMVVFHRTGPTADPLTIYYGLTGDAYNGGDYNRLDGQITFAAGEATVALPITAIDDEVGEATEQVSIYLTAFDQLYSVGQQNSAIVNLVDNNDRPVVNLVNAQATQNEGTTAVLTFEVVGGDGSQLTVRYGVSGTASGADYETLSGTITLPTGGRRTKTLEIDLRSDAQVEGYEILQIDLLESEDYLIGTQNRIQQVIRDTNQSYEYGEIIVSPFALTSDHSVDESKILGDHVYVNGSITNAKVENIDTALRFYVGRSEIGGGDDVKVFFALEGTATPSIDYIARIIDGAPIRPIRDGYPTEILKEFTALSATNNELTIPGSFNGVIVEIIPVNDSIPEGTESITLRLERAEHEDTGTSVPLGLLQSATLHLDDDDTSPVLIQFAKSYTVIGENTSADQRVYEIPVELSAASADTITVGYYVSSATAQGRSSDYTFLNAAGDLVTEGTLSFDPGETTKNIRIAIQADAIPEGMESLTIALEHPTNASLVTPTVSDDLHHRVYIFDALPAEPELKMVKEERWFGTDVYKYGTWDTTTPAYEGVLTEFATDTGTAKTVSRKLTGKITAPETGDYTFYLTHAESTAGRARFYVSSDDDPAHKALLITSGEKSLFEDWVNADHATVSLEAGQTYYVEIQQRKSADIALGWKLPGGTTVNTVLADFDAQATLEPYTVGFVRPEAFYAEGDHAKVLVTLDRPNPHDSISITIGLDASRGTGSADDYTLSSQTLTFAPGEITKSIDLSVLTDTSAEAPELLVLKMLSANGAKVSGKKQMEIWLTDAYAPDIAQPASTLSVSRTATTGAVIGTVDATADTGRSITAWSIVSGNPQLQGSTTPAFAINSDGQLSLANASALPLGDYALRLLLQATDSAGASALSWVSVSIGEGTAGVQTTQTGFSIDALGEFSFAPFASTDTGTVKEIGRGEITRDNTLGLHGTAEAGTLVRVYADGILVGETVAQAGNTWSLITPALADGSHIFNAEMIGASGNIGITEGVMYRIHAQTEVASLSLLTADQAPDTTAANAISAIEAVSLVGAGTIVYSKGAELYLADNAAGAAQLITHTVSSTITGANAVVDFAGISNDAKKIVFGTNDVEAFGFTDLLADTQNPVTDLIVFDRSDSSLKLITSTTVATSSNSTQASFVGFSGDSRYVVYTTENAEGIADFGVIGNGPANAKDIIAYDTQTGRSTLLTHSEVASGKEGSVADASGIHISGDGQFVVFSALDASNLGNDGVAITDVSPTSPDWLATNISTGQIQLLSHVGGSATTSAGLPMTYLGTASHQPYAVFSTDDISALGFSDADVTLGDLVAVNLGTGEFQLISVNTAVTFEKIVGDYVYFSTPDASAFGFLDGYTNELDLLRYSISTGAIELLTHAHDSPAQSIKGAASPYRDTFSMQYTPGSVIASTDGRYVSFAVDAEAISKQSSQIISNSFRFDPGNLTFITDTVTGAIRGLDTEVLTGDVFGPGRHADWDTAYFTPDNSAFVWQTTQMRGIATTDERLFNAPSDKYYGNAVLVFDLSDGVKNAGTIQASKVLTHGAEGVTHVYAGSDVTLLGVSNDSRFAFVQVDDIRNLGNDNVAFKDTNPNTPDVVAVNLTTQEITLLTGENMLSSGFDFSLIGSSETGNIMLATASDLDGIATLAGDIEDNNLGVDVITWNTALLQLVEQATSGLPQLISKVEAGQELVLLKDGNAVDRQTADDHGVITWDIAFLTEGDHSYSLQDPTYATPVAGASHSISDELRIVGQYVSGSLVLESDLV
jgi:hypothetical protein